MLETINVDITKSIGIILLAAGESTRMGSPKQLLTIGGETMLELNVRVAKSSLAQHLVVVLGSNVDAITTATNFDNIKIAYNKDWKEGMASSIRIGLKTILVEYPDVQAVILMVCDQPFVTHELIDNLILTHQDSEKVIVSCNYGNTSGPPTLFHKSMFSFLFELKGHSGAKNVVSQHSDKAAFVDFPKGIIDIDTPQEYLIWKDGL